MGATALYAGFSGKQTLAHYPWRAVLWALAPPAIWLTAAGVQAWLGGHLEYMYNLLYKQTFIRAFNPWHHHKPFYHFLQTLLHDFLPWTPILLLAAPWQKGARAALDNKQRFCWAVVIFVLFFFSLSKGKRGLYILPLYPFAAWLVADYFERLRVQGPGVFTRFVWALPSLILGAVGVGFVLIVLGRLDIIDNASLAATFPTGPAFGFGVVMVLINLYGLFHLCRKKPVRFPHTLIASMCALSFLGYTTLIPWLDANRSPKHFMDSVNRVVAEADSAHVTMAMVDFRAGFRLYGDHPLTELTSLNPDPENPKLLGLPDLMDFLRANPDGWVIIRLRHLREYQEADANFRPTLYLSKAVGDKNTYALIRCDRC